MEEFTKSKNKTCMMYIFFFFFYLAAKIAPVK